MYLTGGNANHFIPSYCCQLVCKHLVDQCHSLESCKPQIYLLLFILKKASRTYVDLVAESEDYWMFVDTEEIFWRLIEYYNVKILIVYNFLNSFMYY